MKKRLPLAILVMAVLISLDQFVKYLIDSSFSVGESQPLIDNVFQLTYVQNRGAAWGSFSGKVVFLLIITTVILIGSIYVYIQLARRTDTKFTPLRICLVFLISGAIGNMIDRIVRGFVVDMFDFCLINFPVFNVADCYVVIGCILFGILILFYYKDQEFDWVLQKKGSRS